MTNQIEAFMQDPQTTETPVVPGGAATRSCERSAHATPWHRQPGDDETFYVLDGEIDFWVEDPSRAAQRAGVGALVVIPRGTPHAFRIASASARWLTLHTPAGHERFYRASGEPAQQAGLPPAVDPDMATVQSAAREHGVELLGPPPVRVSHIHRAPGLVVWHELSSGHGVTVRSDLAGLALG